LLAFVLLFLATQKNKSGQRVASVWMIVLTAIGAVVVLVLAIRTLFRIYLTVFG